MELGKSIENQNNVVARLAKQVIDTEANGFNLVFSPTSINVLLSLIAAGSSPNTKEEILSFLMSPSTDHLNAVLAKISDSGPERSDLCLSAANGVWIDKSFSLKSSFKELLENSYKATCSQVDFATKPGDVMDEVNKWAEVNTNGLIKKILSRDSIETIRSSTLVLANAVYFKAAWSRKFDANLTKDNDFHLLDGNTVKIPFMISYEDQYLRGYDGFQVLRLPYVEDQRQFSMYIYLPNDKDGLPALLERISSEPGFLDNHIPLHRISVDAFRIPKFNFSFEFKASDVLKDMGLTLPFTSGGNLTEMVDSPSNGDKLYVSSILHKACIEVDEEGTEAAAVSVGVIMLMCLRRNPDFVADHPFLFTVREDKSGVILFMGQVLDPSKH
ncbi:Serpin domain [Arabidopsis thaliana x Arabidopsis arenosa]|uniref:Serpin domain n=1 Tax=Arabidopsis thaliana x Arabidopsis arenosa TaxID=1240361 RepID=A0A8T2A5P7_9BRAS|nr:Serpin domain [Arabidopsis thaliana x Arabidopsis arenosa]